MSTSFVHRVLERLEESNRNEVHVRIYWNVLFRRRSEGQVILNSHYVIFIDTFEIHRYLNVIFYVFYINKEFQSISRI